MSVFINYRVGEFYKYPNYEVHYKLIEKRGYKFIFECGHRCTDSVFVDLIRVKTGIQVEDQISFGWVKLKKN